MGKMATFFNTHKRWWVFFALVVILAAFIIFFGQKTSLASFLYVLF